MKCHKVLEHEGVQLELVCENPVLPAMTIFVLRDAEPDAGDEVVDRQEGVHVLRGGQHGRPPLGGHVILDPKDEPPELPQPQEPGHAEEAAVPQQPHEARRGVPAVLDVQPPRHQKEDLDQDEQQVEEKPPSQVPQRDLPGPDLEVALRREVGELEVDSDVHAPVQQRRDLAHRDDDRLWRVERDAYRDPHQIISEEEHPDGLPRHPDLGAGAQDAVGTAGVLVAGLLVGPRRADHHPGLPVELPDAGEELELPGQVRGVLRVEVAGPPLVPQIRH
mmetsp:Transcript_128534/g.363775  ORF Transcript_128534/g.363775 Transcript_128534/m.363775 type:complete len:276 (+) Transcript_128534:1149-1976(+)